MATLIMLDRAGQLMVEILQVQSDPLLLLILLELILVYSCARILNSLVSLVVLIFQHFVSLQLVAMLESTKNDKMFWQLLRYTNIFQVDYRMQTIFNPLLKGQFHFFKELFFFLKICSKLGCHRVVYY